MNVIILQGIVKRRQRKGSMEKILTVAVTKVVDAEADVEVLVLVNLDVVADVDVDVDVDLADGSANAGPDNRATCRSTHRDKIEKVARAAAGRKSEGGAILIL